MKLQEKKYLVPSLAAIQKILKEKGAIKRQEVVSTHYYGQHEGNDVEKFVEYKDKYEIHVLKESSGRFTMMEHRPITDKDAGFLWLKSKGYKNAGIVKMDYAEYDYKNGTVGLYTIDNFLYSVVLYYLPSQHKAIEKEFGLQNVEVIVVPYNNYLEQIGRLCLVKIN
jgi:hypothetical protein